MFRKEVLENKKNYYLGTVFINTPTSYQSITFGIAILAFGLILLLIFGQYQEKFIVTGFLNASPGMSKIYPHKSGTVTASYASIGHPVKKGDVLFIIDTSEDLARDTQKLFHKLQQNQIALERTIQSKMQQLQQLRPLLLKRYIALEAFHQKEEDIIKLKSDKRLIESDMIRLEQNMQQVIHAPVDGLITHVHYQVGQHVDADQALAKILPSNAELVAEIYIPVSQAGFLHPTQDVLIRYDAYPYERFGSYQAVMGQVSQSILTDEEDADKPFRIGQPYYKAVARLQRQSILMFGHEKHLTQGMTLKAVVMGAKRTLWQCLFEPIYGFYGELRL